MSGRLPDWMAPLFERPVRYGRLELALLRAAFAWIVYDTVARLHRSYTTQPHPNGLAHWVDLTFLSDPVVWPILQGVFVVALLAYAVGVALPWALTYLLLITVGVGTLKVSQGAINHSTQIVGLVLLGQWLAWLRYRWRPLGDRSPQDLMVEYAQQMIAAAYTLAGITKIVRSGGRWALDAPLMAPSVVKAHDQHYLSAMQPELFERSLAYGNFVLGHPLLIQVLFGTALLLELFALVALAGRGPALAIGLGLVGMHLGIELVMNIHFPTNQLVVLLFFVQVPFGVAWLVGRVTRSS